jgi:hypothetical protein
MPRTLRSELTRCAVQVLPWPVGIPIRFKEAAMSVGGREMNPDTGWDLIIVGGAGAVVLFVFFWVPIANAIRNKVYERQMRRHFSDTRGRRRGHAS